MQDDGFIAKILVEAGTKDIKVGTPLAIMVGKYIPYFRRGFESRWLKHTCNSDSRLSVPCQAARAV